MAGVDQLQVDPSPLGSIITIAFLYLMILDASFRWPGVQNPMPLGSIGVWLAGYQENRFVLPQ